MVTWSKPNKKQSAEGFTIIEVLIVMAVFGLITVIIFLALPALQRTSRNNQRKQDVQTVLELVSRFELNNSGNIPDQNELTAQLTNYAKLTAYDVDQIIIETPSGSTSAQPDTIIIKNYRKCSTDDAGKDTKRGAGYNDVVALYTVETLHGIAPHCQQL